VSVDNNETKEQVVQPSRHIHSQWYTRECDYSCSWRSRKKGEETREEKGGGEKRNGCFKDRKQVAGRSVVGLSSIKQLTCNAHPTLTTPPVRHPSPVKAQQSNDTLLQLLQSGQNIQPSAQHKQSSG
jgi:hypothetical protein